MRKVVSVTWRLALRVALVACLLLAVLTPLVFALDEAMPDKLPATLTDLLKPAGLGVVVTLLVGLLKRLNSQAHPNILGRFGDWLNATALNQLFMSLVVSGLVIGVVQLILYLGLGDTAQDVWYYLGVAWLTSQGFYNGQKVLGGAAKAALE